ncbi:MAG: hypothetical protein U9N54_09980, partial [candidate division Zixibacteria bacterium]|nr:hypothetical protein [candidate division Zixibacteria bacterium]
LSYINNEDLKKSFDKRKNQILDYVKLGISAEKDGRIGDALKNYYWGYLLSYTYPDTIHLKFNDVISYEPLIALSDRINQVIQNISIKSDTVYQDGDVVVAELIFKYENQPINGLVFSYYSGIGMDYGQVWEGKAVLPIYDEPTISERSLALMIEYYSESEMGENSELAHLHKIYFERVNSNSIETLLKFPWLKKNKPIEKPSERITIPQDSIKTPILEKKPKVEYPSYMKVLSRLTDVEDFLRIIAQYEELGQIQFGKKENLTELGDRYVAIFDEAKVWGIYKFENDIYTEITSGQIIDNISIEFKGKRQIWIKDINQNE